MKRYKIKTYSILRMTKLVNLKEEDDIMKFTIQNIDVSYINGIRRTILSDIPVIGLKTTPYAENKANITANTSRLTNEILKQRLSCIPVCISDINDESIKNYLLEVDVENKTDTTLIVTTKDFKIKNTLTNKYLDDDVVRRIFPPYLPPNGNGNDEYYIDFVRLRPKISDEIPGGKIKLTCEFSVCSSREDSMFNITGTCSYGFTPDEEQINEQLEIRKQKWKDQGKKEAEIKFEAANWKLLEGLRYIKKNSFDFTLQTLGHFTNHEIMVKACNVLLAKFELLKNNLAKDTVEIKSSDNTLDNCYDVILVNEDYTIGNILNYEIYTLFYQDNKALNYVGFKKLHPHDSNSVLRLSLVDTTKGVSTVKTILLSAVELIEKKLVEVKKCFRV